MNGGAEMDVRGKLVELIESARCCGSNTSEEIAENFIAHGVTVQEWINSEIERECSGKQTSQPQ